MKFKEVHAVQDEENYLTISYRSQYEGKEITLMVDDEQKIEETLQVLQEAAVLRHITLCS